MPATSRPYADRIDAAVWRVGAIVVCGTIGASLASTTVSVAFAALSHELDARFDAVQWVSTGYLLGIAAVISTTGWLLRHVGARQLYLAALLLFAATSVLCALAASLEQLIAFRVLQGIAGGLAMPVGQMVLIFVAGPQRMGRVMSVIGIPLVLGPVLGPVCGGLLIDELSWHWLFLMNVPLSLTGFALGLRWLPVLPPQHGGRFDRLGFTLVVCGAPALVYGLAQAGDGALSSVAVLAPILIGTALLIVFVVHALRAERPLLDVRLWQNAGFATCAMIAFFVSGALFGWMFVLPLYLQIARGDTALVTGLMLLPQGIGTALSMAVAGRLTDRVGGGCVALVGVTIGAAAMVAFSVIHPETPDWVLCILLLIRGLGIGGSLMPALAAAYATLSPRQVSDATPQVQMLQRIGGSIGTTLIAVILTSNLSGHVPAVATIGTPASTAVALATPFRATFLWVAALSAVALIPAAALARIERRRPVGRSPRRKIASDAETPVA